MRQAFMITLLCLSTWASAYDFKADGFYCNVLSAADSTVEVTYGDVAYPDDIAIPSRVQHGDTLYYVTRIGDHFCKGTQTIRSLSIGKYVTSIGESAFNTQIVLNEVYIPDNVKVIGFRAFSNCVRLKSIYIGDGVDSIQNEAFRGSAYLQELRIGSNVRYIGKQAFSSNHARVTKLSIPKSVKVIDDGAFAGFWDAEELDLGEVESIGASAFMQLFKLKNLRFPKTLKSIGSRAFEQAELITDIFIPANVTDIGINPFHSCSGIRFIEVDENNPAYDSRNGCNAIIHSASNNLIVGCQTTVIPADVVSIGESAFTMPDISINITIPPSVSTMFTDAFCMVIDTVYISDLHSWLSVTFSGQYSNPIRNSRGLFAETPTLLYLNDELLTDLTIPEDIQKINSYAFVGYKPLKSLSLHEYLGSIDTKAFYGCSELERIDVYSTYPPKITSDTFDKSIYPTSTVYVPYGSKEIFSRANNWSNFKNIVERQATTIESAPLDKVTNRQGKIYNLQGQKMSCAARRGIYIRNGKKIANF
ncbi:MAG: leucine-rich repeat protein [Bacteroidaceae bacterium]|nr:leucine-rich repeat protein [Bacteroidaceae bacterium]